MINPFKHLLVMLKTDFTAPPTGYFEIAKDNDNDLPRVARTLKVQAAGILQVDMLNATNVPVHMVPGDNPGFFTRVYTTGSDDVGRIFGGF
ncbi:MAG: hypothetical protein RPU34_04490 [Candidatus Sedimenticola sp. (ex Thyasira tokunagai)]